MSPDCYGFVLNSWRRIIYVFGSLDKNCCLRRCTLALNSGLLRLVRPWGEGGKLRSVLIPSSLYKRDKLPIKFSESITCRRHSRFFDSKAHCFPLCLIFVFLCVSVYLDHFHCTKYLYAVSVTR